jgi:protein-S-isoprenylcysteine O-methyltransferase Ste14
VNLTKSVFRFRLIIGTAIYVLGFWAPWTQFVQSSNPIRLWSWLAIKSQHIEIFSAKDGVAVFTIQNAYLSITALAVFCAVVGAGLRIWGTAFLGRRVVSANAMHGGEIVAAGPYRYVRNPLYLGSMFTALAVSLLMPASGALFFVVAFSSFVVCLVRGEEAFLGIMIGDSYLEYCRKVSRWLPSLSPRLPASSDRPAWFAAALGETFPLGIALCFLVFAWNYDAQLLIRCVLICFGASLITRAISRKETA